jgi:hypothetical protein
MIMRQTMTQRPKRKNIRKYTREEAQFRRAFLHELITLTKGPDQARKMMKKQFENRLTDILTRQMLERPDPLLQELDRRIALTDGHQARDRPKNPLTEMLERQKAAKGAGRGRRKK